MFILNRSEFVLSTANLSPRKGYEADIMHTWCVVRLNHKKSGEKWKKRFLLCKTFFFFLAFQIRIGFHFTEEISAFRKKVVLISSLIN